MTTTTTNLPTTTGTQRHTFWAWMGVAFTPVLCLIGFGISAVIAYLLDFEPGPADMRWWVADEPWKFPIMVLPALITFMLAPGFGLWHGLRARSAGSRSGTVAAVVAAALLVIFAAYTLVVFLTF
jgi:hypothetical protein